MFMNVESQFAFSGGLLNSYRNINKNPLIQKAMETFPIYNPRLPVINSNIMYNTPIAPAQYQMNQFMLQLLELLQNLKTKNSVQKTEVPVTEEVVVTNIEVPDIKNEVAVEIIDVSDVKDEVAVETADVPAAKSEQATETKQFFQQTISEVTTNSVTETKQVSLEVPVAKSEEIAETKQFLQQTVPVVVNAENQVTTEAKQETTQINKTEHKQHNHCGHKHHNHSGNEHHNHAGHKHHNHS